MIPGLLCFSNLEMTKEVEGAVAASATLLYLFSAGSLVCFAELSTAPWIFRKTIICLCALWREFNTSAKTELLSLGFAF